MTAQAKLHPKIVTEMENNSSAPLEVEHESKMALVRRLEHLEGLVFGQPMAYSTYRREREKSLGERVAAIAKDVATAEGGDNCHMMKLVDQASDLGLLPLLPLGGPSTATPTFAESSNTEVMESILLGSREEIESTARALAQVKSLEQHVNPPFLRDISQMSDMLGRLEGNYLRQAAEVAHITERTEETRLHYGQAISLVSEKFVHWDDRVSRSECEREGGATSAT